MSMSTVAVIDPETESTVIHRQSSPVYDILGDHTFYPVSHLQLRDLIGKLLTQLDAMALPDRAHKAAKTLLTQEVWRWWDTAADNATTSYMGCLAPVVMSAGGKVSSDVPPSNRWGWDSEAQWLSGNPTQSGSGDE